MSGVKNEARSLRDVEGEVKQSVGQPAGLLSMKSVKNRPAPSPSPHWQQNLQFWIQRGRRALVSTQRRGNAPSSQTEQAPLPLILRPILHWWFEA